MVGALAAMVNTAAGSVARQSFYRMLHQRYRFARLSPYQLALISKEISSWNQAEFTMGGVAEDIEHWGER